jgi:hypothetical protein
MQHPKRLVVISDLHCGHRVGLTTPEHQWPTGEGASHAWKKFGKIQKECWQWFSREIKALKPINILVANGDLIDGRGQRSGGTELLLPDRQEQADMAADILGMTEAKEIIIVRGTPYHVGEEESWEDVVARRLECKVGDHEWITIKYGKEETTFDFKHHIGGSQIPHGRATAIKKDELWNVLWAEAGYQPKADWIIRSHVHYYESNTRFAGGRRKVAIITPALQAMGTRFGARRMSGLVDYGFLHWDFYGDGTWDFAEHILVVESQKAQALRF